MDDSTPIADLDLPPHTKRALTAKGYKKLGDLRGVAIYSIDGLGPRSAHSIRRLFAEVDGIEPGSELPDDPIADFGEADRPLTRDERRTFCLAFLEWALDDANAGVTLLLEDAEGRLHQLFAGDEEVARLYDRYREWEEDQACAASENAYDRALER